ncbi:hypothetical protein DAI22_08g253300 [Oryza sativa Japonica Group]|nr:hypothetical protein DAI22_08g253300 [Oryza sativa Japonica Group]
MPPDRRKLLVWGTDRPARSRRDAMRRVMASAFAQSSCGLATTTVARSARERERDRPARSRRDAMRRLMASSFAQSTRGSATTTAARSAHRPVERRASTASGLEHGVEAGELRGRRRTVGPPPDPSAQPSPSSDPPPPPSPPQDPVPLSPPTPPLPSLSPPPSPEPSSGSVGAALPIVGSTAAAFPTIGSGVAEPLDAAAAEPAAYLRRPSLSPLPLPSLSRRLRQARHCRPSCLPPPSPKGEQGKRTSWRRHAVRSFQVGRVCPPVLAGLVGSLRLATASSLLVSKSRENEGDAAVSHWGWRWSRRGRRRGEPRPPWLQSQTDDGAAIAMAKRRARPAN